MADQHSRKGKRDELDELTGVQNADLGDMPLSGWLLCLVYALVIAGVIVGLTYVL